MVRVLIVLFAIAAPLLAWPHGGGIDKCGGHKDKKRGGYHVHQIAKYCGCFPTASECKVKVPAKSAKK